MEESAGSNHSSTSSTDQDHPVGYKTAQCSVVSTYHADIAGASRTVTVAWSKNLINHSLSVSVAGAGDADPPHTCKIDLKPWPFWSKKGFKSLDLDHHHDHHHHGHHHHHDHHHHGHHHDHGHHDHGHHHRRVRVDIFWDLRSAKYSSASRPEPLGGYYVAMVCDEEVVLLLGDCKKEAYKRTKSRPSLVDAALVSKRENVFGKRCFSTRAKFDERARKEHDIVVENSISAAAGDSAAAAAAEMWISIDGVVLIHVDNLRWKFRGNETVLVERVPVQVFWDVHDWLFCAPGIGHALFAFKPEGKAAAAEQGGDGGGRGGGSATENDGVEESVKSCSQLVPEFCFFLSAWKLE